jgi:hypothetical protein
MRSDRNALRERMLYRRRDTLLVARVTAASNIAAAHQLQEFEIERASFTKVRIQIYRRHASFSYKRRIEK